MKYIDEQKIRDVLGDAQKASAADVEAVLAKSRTLKGLTLKETAVLLSVPDPALLKKILETAAWVKNEIYGSRIVLFAPLYTSNFCMNGCLYCGFKADNKSVKRKALASGEISREVAWLLGCGHKRILLVAGESRGSRRPVVEDYVEAIEAVYRVRIGAHQIRRVNINCAPLSVDDFRKLKTAGIGTYQLFQETYHDATYRRLHPYGPKSDPDNRLDAIDRAFRAGIDDVGIGPLYGLYDYRFETLALLEHVRHLEETFGIGPHTISVPRIEPAHGVDFISQASYKLSDEEFKKTVAVLRLAVPYTGIILTTREVPAFRDELFAVGVSQVSAGSRTSPGGYTQDDGADDGQFFPNDSRNLDQVIGSLLEKGLCPSFCAACYRKERTGATFMGLAKPGTIKGKCQMNALITLKEYLDDFASPGVKERGYRLIEEARTLLDEDTRRQLSVFFDDIQRGIRDAYV
ncbi:MAG: [FeFe] hydrogenase H-cluster radical SAM maturase HydG [Candidatus Velamenicoccus archaeovorus]